MIEYGFILPVVCCVLCLFSPLMVYIYWYTIACFFVVFCIQSENCRFCKQMEYILFVVLANN